MQHEQNLIQDPFLIISLKLKIFLMKKQALTHN